MAGVGTRSQRLSAPPLPLAPCSRRLIALLATLLALTFLAGCGDDDKATDDGSDDDDTSAAAPPDREPTGVTCEYTEDGMGAGQGRRPAARPTRPSAARCP